jgi:CRISPR type IV-associated protein Csf1
MTNTQMIVSAITKKQRIETEKTCCLCGGNKIISEWTKSKEVFSGNFTDYNYLKNKQSDILCDFCTFALSDKSMDSPKGKKCGLRLYSFLVENNDFTIINYDEKAYYLFEHAFNIPFILAFSSTGQKHISYKSVINYSSDIFTVSTDFMNIIFDRALWFQIYEIANNFYQNKCTKDELLNCSIPPWKFNKYDINFVDYQKLKRVQNTEQYKLIVSILIKLKEEKSCQESTQKLSQLALFS